MKSGLKFTVVGLAVLLPLPSLWSQPTTNLKPTTIEAFEKYVSKTEKDFEIASEKQEPATWLTQLDPSERQAIRKGKILIERVEDVPEILGGIIHDWAGAIYIPGVTVKEVLDLLSDYDGHKEIYDEAVESSTLEKGDNYVRGRLLLKKVKVLTVVLDTEHRAEIRTPGETGSHILSRSTRIAEIRNFGTPEQEELPVGKDSGFLWRMNAYWSIWPDGDNVMVECSTISLSRDIPWGLGWVIGPFVESMPRETLEDTLQATRLALVNRQEKLK